MIKPLKRLGVELPVRADSSVDEKALMSMTETSSLSFDNSVRMVLASSAGAVAMM